MEITIFIPVPILSHGPFSADCLGRFFRPEDPVLNPIVPDRKPQAFYSPDGNGITFCKLFTICVRFIKQVAVLHNSCFRQPDIIFRGIKEMAACRLS